MEKRVLGMARHMGQVFKFEKFKNQVWLDFKFFSSQVGLDIDLTWWLAAYVLVWLWDPYSKPRLGFFAGINEWLKETIKFSKNKLKL